MNILITGGGGFIGSNLALFLQNNHHITVLDDFSSGSFKNLTDFSGEIIVGDIRSAGFQLKTKGLDLIINLASITDTTVVDERLMMDVNLEGFRNILNFAVKSGIKKVVYASSAGVYGNGPVPMKENQSLSPLNIYAFSKLAMEGLAKKYSQEFDITTVGLRFFNVYGPREAAKGKFSSMIYQLMQQIKQGKRPRIFHNGEQKRDFIFVDDVVSAIVKAMDYNNTDVFNVGTGTPATFNQIIQILNTALSTNFPPDYFENPYTFYQNHTEADISASQQKLGFTPQYSPEDGINAYIKFLAKTPV